MPKIRKLRILDAAYKDLLAVPQPVRKMTGFVLDRVQRGEHHNAIKSLKGKDFAGVYEIRINEDGDIYRSVYALNIGETIYLIDVFQKKSKKGIATPKQDLDRILTRIKAAKELENNEQNKNKKKGYVEVSNNIFADLQVDHPEAYQLKSRLASLLYDSIEAKGWTQTKTAKVLGITQPDVSNICRGLLDHFSSEKLLTFLAQLDNRVTITVEDESKDLPPQEIVIAASQLTKEVHAVKS